MNTDEAKPRPDFYITLGGSLATGKTVVVGLWDRTISLSFPENDILYLRLAPSSDAERVGHIRRLLENGLFPQGDREGVKYSIDYKGAYAKGGVGPRAAFQLTLHDLNGSDQSQAARRFGPSSEPNDVDSSPTQRGALPAAVTNPYDSDIFLVCVDAEKALKRKSVYGVDSRRLALLREEVGSRRERPVKCTGIVFTKLDLVLPRLRPEGHPALSVPVPPNLNIAHPYELEPDDWTERLRRFVEQHLADLWTQLKALAPGRDPLILPIWVESEYRQMPATSPTGPANGSTEPRLLPRIPLTYPEDLVSEGIRELFKRLWE